MFSKFGFSTFDSFGFGCFPNEEKNGGLLKLNKLLMSIYVKIFFLFFFLNFFGFFFNFIFGKSGIFYFLKFTHFFQSKPLFFTH